MNCVLITTNRQQLPTNQTVPNSDTAVTARNEGWYQDKQRSCTIKFNHPEDEQSRSRIAGGSAKRMAGPNADWKTANEQHRRRTVSKEQSMLNNKMWRWDEKWHADISGRGSVRWETRHMIHEWDKTATMKLNAWTRNKQSMHKVAGESIYQSIAIESAMIKWWEGEKKLTWRCINDISTRG